jgi:AraC-like DNA-binding protein
LTYIVVLCLPVLTWLVANRSYHGALMEREKKTNLAQLIQSQGVIDQYFHALDQLARHASSSPAIGRALRVHKPLRSTDYISYKDAVDAIFNMNIAYTGIDHLYVYMNNTGEILCHSGKYTKNVFYESYHKDSTFSNDEWEALLIENRQTSLIPCTIEAQRKILYACPIAPEGADSALGQLVIQLNAAQIEKMLPNVEGGYSALLDADNAPLCQKGDAAIWETIKGQIDFPSAEYDLLSENKRILVGARPSQMGHLGYVSATPLSSLNKDVNNLLYTIFGIVAASVMLAFITSVYFARRISGFLGITANALDLSLARSEGHVLNRLRDAALRVVTSNKEIMHHLSMQRPMAKNQFMLRLLQGEAQITEEYMQMFGLSFPYRYFCCIQAKAADEWEYDDSPSRPDILLASAFLQHELRPMGITEVVLPSYNTALLVLNREDDSISLETLAEACDRARRQTVTAGGYELHIAIGTWKEGLKNLPSSYFEAVSAERARFAAGSKAICHYAGETTNMAYFFPGRYKKRLAGAILSGDVTQAKDVIESLMAQNDSMKMSATAIKALLLDICSTMLSGFTENADVLEQEEIMVLMDDVIMGSVQADGAVERIYDIIQSLCEARQEICKSSRMALRDRMLRCVDENFADPNASIASIAQAAGLNSSYLSHSFKELVGDTVMDAVHKKRIELAKELMKQEDLTLSAISRKAGYISDTVFIRNFKKWEGITPGRYRQLRQRK